MSVIMPVTWVVRISARDSLVIMAFCKPMTKHSSETVIGANSHLCDCMLPPSMPKHTSNIASRTSGKAYSLRKFRCRAQLIIIAEVAAPPTNDISAPTAASMRANSPMAIWSAMDETMPDICEVYCATARKPPAFVAPAIKAKKPAR